MAGLNFVGNAKYAKPAAGAKNVAQYEFIPFILSSCESVEQARRVIAQIDLFYRYAFQPADAHGAASLDHRR